MGLKDQSTEAKILNAAKEVFMKFGLYGARMQDIADLAGINKALLHYYFRNKEKLFNAVFESALEKYFQQVTVMGDTSMSVEERLFKYVDNVFDFFEEYPQMTMFIIKEVSINPELFKQKVIKLKENRPFVIPMLQQAIDNKEIAEMDPIVFIVNLHSMCAYPFLGAPLFRGMMKNNGYDWDQVKKEKIKDAVKEFISFKLNRKDV